MSGYKIQNASMSPEALQNVSFLSLIFGGLKCVICFKISGPAVCLSGRKIKVFFLLFGDCLELNWMLSPSCFTHCAENRDALAAKHTMTQGYQLCHLMHWTTPTTTTHTHTDTHTSLYHREGVLLQTWKKNLRQGQKYNWRNACIALCMPLNVNLHLYFSHQHIVWICFILFS